MTTQAKNEYFVTMCFLNPTLFSFVFFRSFSLQPKILSKYEISVNVRCVCYSTGALFMAFRLPWFWFAPHVLFLRLLFGCVCMFFFRSECQICCILLPLFTYFVFFFLCFSCFLIISRIKCSSCFRNGNRCAGITNSSTQRKMKKERERERAGVFVKIQRSNSRF